MGKYFGTDGFRGEANVTLTVEHAYKVGVGQVVNDHHQGTDDGGDGQGHDGAGYRDRLKKRFALYVFHVCSCLHIKRPGSGKTRKYRAGRDD